MTPETEILQKFTPSKIVKIMKDPIKSAKAVQLIYTSDQGFGGIERKRYGKNSTTIRTAEDYRQ